MDIKKIRIENITDVFYVFSKKGDTDETVNRKTYGLTFCEKGKITYVQNGVKTVSNENNVILLPKCASYKILRQATGYFPVINFTTNTEISKRILSFDISSNKKLLELFFTLKENFIKNNTLESLSIFYKILSEIFEHSPSDKASEIIKFINDNLSDVTLSSVKIANNSNISVSYLNKLFLNKYGISPKKYIIHKRIELASRLLAENRYNISEISEKCGYSNLYSFSRAFKNCKSVSPSKYKRISQNKI